VERLVPFHCAVELEMKFVPFIVSVNPAPPAVPDEGESDVIDGTGFDGGGVIVDDDEPPHPESSAIARKTIPQSGTLSIPASALGIFTVWRPYDSRPY